MKHGLISRDTLLAEATLLVRKDAFSREDSARANALMSLAERLGPGNGAGSPEARALDKFIRGKEYRDEQVVGDAGLGGNLVAQAFLGKMFEELAAYDAIFDPEVTTRVTPDTGAPLPLPAPDDTSNAAVLVSEKILGDRNTVKFDVKTLPQLEASYRTGLVAVSKELLQDSGYDISGYLARAFALRFALGIGPDLVDALLADAMLGATATGDENASSPEPTLQIGYSDLLALRKSVNPAYRASAKCGWLMNDDTLTDIDELRDLQGRPIFRHDFNAAGNRTIFGYPVYLCPSMPTKAAGEKPIAFGALDYFVVRVVKPLFAFMRLDELVIEYGLVGFTGLLRCDGGLVRASNADSPVKYLQMAD